MQAPQQPPPPQPILGPKEQLEMKARIAERAHDDEKEFSAGANQAAIKAAEEAIKAIILINGGSSVAMLAFIGTLASKEVLASTYLGPITRPLLWFGAGVACAVVASAAAYFTNLMIAGSSSRKERHYEVPFLRDTPSSSRHRRLGEVFRYLGVLAFVASVGCFVGGLVSAQQAFKALAQANIQVNSEKPAVPPASH